MDQLRQQRIIRQMSRDAARNSILQKQRMDNKNKDTDSIAYRWENENPSASRRKRNSSAVPTARKHGMRMGKVGRRGTLTVVIIIAIFCIMALIMKQII